MNALNATPLSVRLENLRPLTVPSLPSYELLQRTAQKILDRYDTPTVEQERDAERLFAEMLRRIRENDWYKVPMSLVMRVAGLVFSAAHRLREDLAGLRSFMIREVSFSSRPGFLNPMMRIYLESYEAGAKHTQQLAAVLKASQDRLGTRWQELLLNVPKLLDPVQAPFEVASLMDKMEDPWHELRMLGIRQPHGQGLMEMAHHIFVRQIASKLSDRSQIERLLAWLKPAGQRPRQTGAGQAIDAILNIWSNQDPPSDIKEMLIDRITDLYGHPRVNRSAIWNEVDTKRETVFLRWLMGADIRFLFKVLTEVESRHMWADREAFWWSLYEQGLIDEVWIAFNEDGYRAAINKLPMESRHNGHRFAKQIGEKDKSLLLMRIGNQIIIEGTYSFMIHAFDAYADGTPKLYEPFYDVAKIRAVGRNALWTQKHQGYWQYPVLRRL